MNMRIVYMSNDLKKEEVKKKFFFCFATYLNLLLAVFKHDETRETKKKELLKVNLL